MKDRMVTRGSFAAQPDGLRLEFAAQPDGLRLERPNLPPPTARSSGAWLQSCQRPPDPGEQNANDAILGRIARGKGRLSSNIRDVPIDPEVLSTAIRYEESA
jgi:hypothetical protein